jgi:hypothetical protein
VTPTERVAAIRERLEAADHLPWHVGDLEDGNGFAVLTERGNTVVWDIDWRESDRPLAELIAHAPADLAYLLTLAEAFVAMPEPIFAGTYCAYCRYCGMSVGRAEPHYPACPWQVGQRALRGEA